MNGYVIPQIKTIDLQVEDIIMSSKVNYGDVNAGDEDIYSFLSLFKLDGE